MRNAMAMTMWLGAVLAWGATCAAAPPLTELQRAMLADGATDEDAVLEQAGLYALLRNAAAWESGDERGAAIPDYDALYAAPAEHRGEAVLIEGELLRASSRRVERSGVWGEEVAEWVIEISADPVDVAVVLMPDPEGAAAEAPRGARVRLPARFFKVMRTTNVGSAGGEGRFLVFVGPTPAVPEPASGTWLQPLLTTALVILGLGILLVLRKAMSPTPRPLNRKHREHERERLEAASGAGGGSGAEEEDEPAEPLPKDPVAAMERLGGER